MDYLVGYMIGAVIGFITARKIYKEKHNEPVIRMKDIDYGKKKEIK